MHLVQEPWGRCLCFVSFLTVSSAPLSPPDQCCCAVQTACPSSPEELEKLQWYVASLLALPHDNSRRKDSNSKSPAGSRDWQCGQWKSFWLWANCCALLWKDISIWILVFPSLAVRWDHLRSSITGPEINSLLGCDLPRAPAQCVVIRVVEQKRDLSADWHHIYWFILVSVWGPYLEVLEAILGSMLRGPSLGLPQPLELSFVSRWTVFHVLEELNNAV